MTSDRATPAAGTATPAPATNSGETPDATPAPAGGPDWPGRHGAAFRGVRALVTGGAGFIGLHLTDALLSLGATVCVIDDLSGSAADGVRAAAARVNPAAGGGPERLRFVHASILDRDALADAAAGAELVFHQAALGSVPASVERPRDYHAVNVTGTLNVLQAAAAAGARRVVFAASSAAYGGSPVLPKVETLAPDPQSPYAANKVAGEAMLRAFAHSYGGAGRGPDTVSLRYFNVFGPRQNANSAYAAVIAAFAKALLAGTRPTIYGDGTQSRDFTHVDNAVHANLLAARHDGPLNGCVLNVACGVRVTVAELAAAMAAALGRPELTARHEPPRAGDVMHSQADLTAARATLGYAPVTGFTAGLAGTVAWYRAAAAAAVVAPGTTAGAAAS